MVYVAGGRLHTAEGELSHSSSKHSTSVKWATLCSSKNDSKTLLDLLVPSAEGGIFHFI
ncbi:hypothetical protein F4824DRAFT_462870 [Ustulina deusta]|nr:hypothetical protein F4824DRAFT_462870 [Ustulina deusta]